MRSRDILKQLNMSEADFTVKLDGLIDKIKTSLGIVKELRDISVEVLICN